MAYDASNEIKKDLAVLDKNERGDKVMVTRVDYKDKDRASTFDIRAAYTKEDGSVCPTAKGIRISTDMTIDIIVALVKGMDESSRDDLMEKLELAAAFGGGDDDN